MTPREGRGKKGRVFLVGAGPGDPGLLTLRALELLKTADLVIYDRLVGRGVLRLIPTGAKKVYGGKAPHSDGERGQRRLNELMLRSARRGEVVVRLKGGDALLFSRGAEEAEFLREHGVEFEVVPGVSSALAVPARAGIPLTHRDYSSSVTVVTGREAVDKRGVDWKGVARGSDSIVVLMGAARIGEIARMLLEGGKPAGTPVAAIMRGTTERERTVVTTLGEAAELGAEGLAIGPPAVIVVGRVVSLRQRLKPDAST